MNTDHIYGCEHRGCPNIGEAVRVYPTTDPPYVAYLCPDHRAAFIKEEK